MKKRKKWIGSSLATVITIFGVIMLLRVIYHKNVNEEEPIELLKEYMAHIQNQEYEQMYLMIDKEASENISKDEFIKRNKGIYEGIELRNLKIEDISYKREQKKVSYKSSFDTLAGNISFENEVSFLKKQQGYKMIWDDAVIFPKLSQQDKVRVSIMTAERGKILDRNGWILAGDGTASSVGIIPGKLKNQDQAVKKIAKLLEIEPEIIEKKLTEKWVKEDSFVPIQTIRKIDDTDLMNLENDIKIQTEYKRQNDLLKIPGVMISDTKVRSYPLGEAASHLIGYVQNVTAEDLEKHSGEDYNTNSVMGKSGLEGLYEKELKGTNGCRIYIIDSDGNEKEQLAWTQVENGKDIKLTIDSDLQKALYAQFQQDKSCSTAINPFTGEVLAMVSTPSYDSNIFVMGLSGRQWKKWNEDERKPLYNRFRQVWCPGSTFKPIVAAIGLENESIDPKKDYGNEGLSWQKDSSWGSYHVTTLHEYEPVVLENALIYSDNIYFAKAALEIGSKYLENSLLKLGFQKEVPFDLKMQLSQYSNTEHIETEILLADTGYGQGQVLINPLHMACLYTAFCNDGDVLKPYLIYEKDQKKETWISKVFSQKTICTVLDGIKKAVNDPELTGYTAHRDDIVLAGKTGTAEIKASKQDTNGTELGWFCIFTAENSVKKPVLIVSMVEDVKERGGSEYVVKKDKQVLEEWFH